MTTLITQGGSEGASRRCDARCHGAVGRECDCVCGGRLHGVGIANAQEVLTEQVGAAEFVEMLRSRGAEVRRGLL